MRATHPLINRNCDKCGARLRKGKYVFSRFTRKHYCSDLEGCERRARRRPPPPDPLF